MWEESPVSALRMKVSATEKSQRRDFEREKQPVKRRLFRAAKISHLIMDKKYDDGMSQHSVVDYLPITA